MDKEKYLEFFKNLDEAVSELSSISSLILDKIEALERPHKHLKSKVAFAEAKSFYKVDPSINFDAICLRVRYECDLLAAMLLNEEVLDHVYEAGLDVSDFHVTKHQELFRNIKKLYEPKKAVDLVALVSAMDENKSTPQNAHTWTSYVAEILDQLENSRDWRVFLKAVENKNFFEMSEL